MVDDNKVVRANFVDFEGSEPSDRSRSVGTLEPRPASGPSQPDQLPGPHLRAAPSNPDFAALPFTSLYFLDDEFAAEIANGTVHAVKHIGRVAEGTGGFRAHMAVLVKPNGLFGSAYMAAIRPFRHLIVYPPMMREAARTWRASGGDSAPPYAGRRSAWAA